MSRRFVMAATFLGIAACATPGPESAEPVANAEISATNDASPATTGGVEVVDIPEVPKVTDIPVRDEVVCSMEKRTGTNRAKRVCRSRSSINRTAIDAKEAFDDLRRSQVEYS